jgi:general secretion pathway protein M
MLWMSDMEANFAVRVAAIELDRRPAPGAISARLLLEDMQ